MQALTRQSCVGIALALFFIGATPKAVPTAEPNAAPLTKDRWNVAIVVHDNVELLDFSGPAEVFASAARGRAFRLYTVSETVRPIRSQRFLAVTPEFSIADCPKPDIVVIPGGDTNMLLRSPAFMAWIRATAKDADVMFSVCTGALVLAQAGLLDGLEATTHASSISALKLYPRIRVCENRRFVDNGKIVTTAGVSAGIDGALHLVSRLCGLDTAKQTASFMEYHWEPEAYLLATLAPLSPDVLAAHCWFAGKWPEAEKAYQQIVDQQPKDVVALYRLAESQFRNRRYEEAAINFERAVQDGRRDGDTISTLAVIQFRLKRFAAATENFESTLKLGGAPEPIVHYHLARIYALTGQKDKALVALERAFELGIDNAEPALLEADMENVRTEKRFREVFRKYAYACRATMVSEKEPGDPLIVTGVVRDAGGKPVPGAIVYVYHTDAHGLYTTNDAGGAANPRLFAYLRTGGDGTYEFRTIRPAGYPDSEIPQHIHYEVTSPGYRNYIGEVLFADDPRLKSDDRARAQANGAVVTVTPGEDGIQRCTFDLTMTLE